MYWEAIIHLKTVKINHDKHKHGSAAAHASECSPPFAFSPSPSSAPPPNSCSDSWAASWSGSSVGPSSSGSLGASLHALALPLALAFPFAAGRPLFPGCVFPISFCTFLSPLAFSTSSWAPVSFFAFETCQGDFAMCYIYIQGWSQWCPRIAFEAKFILQRCHINHVFGVHYNTINTIWKLYGLKLCSVNIHFGIHLWVHGLKLFGGFFFKSQWNLWARCFNRSAVLQVS